MIVVACDECYAVAHRADADELWLQHELLVDRHFCSTSCLTTQLLRERIEERRGVGVRLRPR